MDTTQKTVTEYQRLRIERRKLYGPNAPRTARYFVSLGNEGIANDISREVAQAKAFETLYQSYMYVGSLCAARVAKDGTVLIVRETQKGIAQVEYNRAGKSGSVSMGRMTNGTRDFRDIQEYADYLLGQYQGTELG